MLHTLIHDGDHGGDDFITTLLFAAYPEFFKLLGVTTCPGNTNAAQAAINAIKALDLAGDQKTPVHTGAPKPLRIPYMLGDTAFGGDGMGHVKLPEPSREPNSHDGGAWMAQTILKSADPVTLCVSGPATNVALLLGNHPETKNNIRQIVIMGGGTNPAGNIKPYAEFNFYMDPDAANIVLTSGVPVILHTLGTTHSVSYGPARQKRILSLMPEGRSKTLNAIMRITEDLEMGKFKSDGAFMHDHHVCAWLAMPDNYETIPVNARVLCGADENEPGRLIVTPAESGSVRLVTRIVDTEKFFDFVLTGLARVLKS